jgi:putative flippase GtrA
LGLLVAGWLAKLIKVIYQVAKFILVGTLNTFVDWGVLNLLIFLTAIASGPFYSVFKGAGFVIASINSYFWNKYWTFNKPVSSVSQPGEQKSASKEILQFFVVSLIGFVMNVGVASLIVNWWGPQFGITAKLWANVGALCGTLVGLVWNFLGYKLIVFKS